MLRSAGLRSFGSQLTEPTWNPGRSNLAAWFVLLGRALAKVDSLMAFVLPSAVLQNDNLREWRKWIRTRYDLTIWHTECDIWFSDARVAPCVLLFTPRSSDARRSTDLGRVVFVNAMERTSPELIDVNGSPVPCAHVELRDLSSLEGDDDLLIEGTKPSCLASFEAAPCTAVVADLGGCESAAGQKLGHAFYKLVDRSADESAVLRTVVGLRTTFRVNRRHLVPLLDSPKKLKSGEHESSGVWLLSLPRERPTSPAIQQYISFAKSQRVHEAPSVASRGSSWWSLEPEKVDIAVPMNSQFQHQIAWLQPRGVANNNFNVISCANRSNAELIAASLASAFGALSRLYVSGEVGCEGARRLLLSQFERWPCLNPEEVDTQLREECVELYRRYRVEPSYEIDEMPAELVGNWEELTKAVAAAAMGRRDAQSDELALSAIRECQTTVSRRRVREAMALSGRTRQSRTGGTVDRRLREWCASSDTCSRVIALLTSGPAVIRLRGADQVDLMTLFGSEPPFHDDHERERRLCALLGEGFECAPPDAISQDSELDELLTGLDRLAALAPIALIGEPPEVGSPTERTWLELRDEVQALLTRRLQAEVRNQLS